MSNSLPQFIPLVSSKNSQPDHSKMIMYLDSSPYPKVSGDNDPATVSMLKSDYAGASGELTAITQYVFQNGRTTDETLANSILQIAIVEMMHLDMLGDAITTLGGNPSFDDENYYWNASKVNYVTDIKEILKADVEAEKTAINNYRKHAALTKNQSVKALLERIIKDEELHLRFFSETLASM